MGGPRCYRRTCWGLSTYCWKPLIKGVFRTGQRLTLHSGFSARCRPACPRPRASSRRRFRWTPITAGPICISVRLYCISVNRKRASRHLNRRSGFARTYGLKGDLDRAKSALAESLRLKPALRSVARMRAENPWLSNPQYWALQEKTLNLGLRRAGLPDQ